MLNDIKLTNFKCFSEQHVPLSDLTLLTGLNGMGKSSALQALLLLRQSLTEGMLPAKGLLLNGPLVKLGTASEVLFRGASNDELGFGLSADGVEETWRFAYESPYSDIMRTISSPDTKPQLLGTPFHYVAAERLGPRALYDVSRYEIEQRREMGSDGRYAIAFLDSIGSNQVSPLLQHPAARDSNVRAQVEAWLGEITPGAQVFTQPYPELNRVRLSIGFESGRTNTKPFSPPSVGFGLSYVLPVLIAILGATPGSLVLIENPEAHLHPKAQSAVGRLLCLAAATGLQIIVETHSDHILNGIRVGVKNKLLPNTQLAVHFFGRRINEETADHFVETMVIDKDGRLDYWPPGFFDEWENSLNQLLD